VVRQDSGELDCEVYLEPYESPDVPEQFMVVRTTRLSEEIDYAEMSRACLTGLNFNASACMQVPGTARACQSSHIGELLTVELTLKVLTSHKSLVARPR
jgi:hypothetical protein